MFRMIGAVVVLSVGAAAASAGVVEARFLLLSDVQAPGLDPGVLIDTFSTPILNNRGDVIVTARLVGVGVDSDNDRAAWLISDDGGIELLVREGDPAVGQDPGVVVRTFDIPRISDGGTVAIRGTLFGPGVTTLSSDFYMRRTPGGVMEFVLREGEQAPGLLEGITIDFPQSISFGANDEFVFRSFLAGTGVSSANNMAVWLERGFGPELIARTGEPAQGTGPGVTFKRFGSVAMSSETGVALIGTVEGPGVDEDNDNGVWINTATGPELLVREGDDSPAFPGTPLNIFNELSITGGETVAFRGHNGFDGNQAVYKGDLGGFGIVAKRNDPVPGEAIAGFGTFENPIINSNGDTCFVASFGNTQGIFAERDGVLRPVAVEGDEIPDAFLSERWGDFITALFETRPAMNAVGNIAFMTNFTGPGVNPVNDNDTGLFAESDGVLRQLARERNFAFVGDGDFRTIDSIDFQQGSADTDGRTRGFNDRGQLVFLLRFTDGTEGVRLFNLEEIVAEVCAGDCDGSGSVAFNDLVAMLFEFGPAGDSSPACDATGDDEVNFNDLVATLFLFGPCP